MLLGLADTQRFQSKKKKQKTKNKNKKKLEKIKTLKTKQK